MSHETHETPSMHSTGMTHMMHMILSLIYQIWVSPRSLMSSFICFDLRHPDDPLRKAIKTINTFVSFLIVPTDCRVILHFFGFSFMR